MAITDASALAAIGSFFLFVGCCALVVVLLIQRRRRFKLMKPCKPSDVSAIEDVSLEEGGRLNICSLPDLLSPPPAISVQHMFQLRQFTSAMMRNCANDDGEVDVFISYALDHRETDVEGAGPGLYYAAAVLRALHIQGLRCRLVVPGVLDSGAFLKLLTSCRDSSKVLLVVETRAFFVSRHCLDTIYGALESSLDIRRIRFDGNVPEIHECWPSIRSADVNGKKRVTDVELRYLTLPTYPVAPATVFDDAVTLLSLAVRLKVFRRNAREYMTLHGDKLCGKHGMANLYSESSQTDFIQQPLNNALSSKSESNSPLFSSEASSKSMDTDKDQATIQKIMSKTASHRSARRTLRKCEKRRTTVAPMMTATQSCKSIATTQSMEEGVVGIKARKVINVMKETSLGSCRTKMDAARLSQDRRQQPVNF